MVRGVRLVVALVVFTSALPALATSVKVTGRIVHFGKAKTPIANATVKIYNACKSRTPKDDDLDELGKDTTSAEGNYEITVVDDQRSVCVYSRETNHLSNQKPIKLASTEVNAGDLALKPLPKGAINFAALAEIYDFHASEPEVQVKFVHVFVAAAMNGTENRQSAGKYYVNDRAFRAFVDTGCDKNPKICMPLADDIKMWKLAANGKVPLQRWK